MIFYSLEFALFAALAFGLYWLLPQKQFRVQNLLILIASYGFYAWWDWRFLALIFISSITDYLVGLLLGRAQGITYRRVLVGISLVVNLGLLGFFKYYNFFVESLVLAFSGLGFELQARTLYIILPVGISFYTFQTLSYTLDLYRRKIKPERDPIAFFAYVSFFPQLVAGPIERASSLLPQFKAERRFTLEKGKEGLQLFLLGLFKKILIADNCAPYVDFVHANYDTVSSSTLALGAVLFFFQIYGDFSGYSDMARGLGKLFGIELMQNFRRPFFAQNPAELWQRWHISLSSWFRDYVFMPLTRTRLGRKMPRVSLLITFGLSGLWHGAAAKYIIWGLIHGFKILAHRSLKKSFGTAFSVFRYPAINIAITLSLTSLTWVFFRAPSAADAVGYLTNIFSMSLFSAPENFQYSIVIPILLLLCYEYTQEVQNSRLGRVVTMAAAHRPVRWATYYAVLIGLLATGTNTNQFIYFQF